ncbi:MAG: FeoB-associated Cys-rich membrane protein [Candidatus Xenobia bacterium]
MDVQYVVVYLIVAVAVATLLRRVFSAARSNKGKKGCGGACRCGTTAPPQPQLVKRS